MQGCEKFVQDNLEKFVVDMNVQRKLNYYSCALSNIENMVIAIDNEYFLKYNHHIIEHTKTRIKSMPSLLKKVYDRNLEMDMDIISENIFDIAGIRLICPYISDIYTLENYILNQNDITLGERKDYIASPKPNGYRSLHLIVKIDIQLCGKRHPINVEIQLRTITMDFWAILEHAIKYKYECQIDDSQINRALLDRAQQCNKLDRKMEQIKLNQVFSE